MTFPILAPDQKKEGSIILTWSRLGGFFFYMSIEIIATLYHSTVLTYGVQQSTVCSTITYNNLLRR